MNDTARDHAIAAYPCLQLFIDGHWIERENRDAGEVIDPSTGKVLGMLPHATTVDLDRAIAAAAGSFEGWKRTPALERSRILRSAAAHLRIRRQELVQLIALELGKPPAEAVRETETACEMLEWGAEEARRLYGRIIPARVPNISMMAVPTAVGPVGAASGWNAPSITPARKLSAALAAGCTIVLKPSEATPATALFVVRALHEAGVPAGVVNVVFGNPSQTVSRLAADPALRLISFTGGTQVGKTLAAIAAGNMKRMVFELGGHAPVLVFNDANTDVVAKAAVAAKFRNSGQICTSPTRFLVQRESYARFLEIFVATTEKLTVGDPFAPGTDMGPMQNQRRVVAIQDLIRDACERGATLATGGRRIDRPGFWHEPTVLTDVPAEARALHEEPFGPVAIMRPFDDIDDAIREANRLDFGLAAYAFSNSLRTVERVSVALNCGTLAVNHWTASLAETPFGGMKDSGIGAEGGVEGIAAFIQTRFISVSS